MKIFCLLLLLANACFFGYTQLDRWAGSHPDQQFEPVNADKVRQLTSQQVAALGPAKVAQLNTSCVEWGPFNELDKSKALKAIEPLQLGKTVSAIKTDVTLPYWVHIPAKPNKSAMDKAITEIRAMKLTEVEPINSGEDQFAISFGHYRDEASARTRLADVERKGVRTARLLLKPYNANLNMVLIREPMQGSMAKLEELKKSFLGSELKTTVCPERG
jgi:hypothetical protein